MFGDAGHGVILTLFGGFMVLREQQLTKKKINSEVSDILENVTFHVSRFTFYVLRFTFGRGKVDSTFL